MITKVLISGGIGCLVFTGLMYIISITGIAAEIRDEEGNFRKDRTWKSVIGFFLFLSFLFGLLYVGNQFFISSFPEKSNLYSIWLHSFLVFMVVHTYDLIVLDYLIIVKWHPKCLNLPETIYYRSIKPHLRGFFRGIPFGIAASLLITLLSL